jgi:NAD(P)-dependent dehydrogenase (short-subunit alcohol dehydrogenase family)
MKKKTNELESFSRRKTLKNVFLGAGAIATTSVLGDGNSHAQENNLETTALETTAKEMTGKTAFITGGARGIGLAVAVEMAKAGANIVIYDIATEEIPNVGYKLSTENDLEQAKITIEEIGVKCMAIKGDVRNRETLESAMDRAVSNFGSLDIVVANAGVSQAGAIEEFSDRDINVVFEINVGGVIKTTQAAAPIMKKQKSGRIIYISSGLGRMGNELFPVYTASKWAVIGFAKSAALSYAKENIMCNVICPALVNTKLANNPYILEKMAPNSPKMETIWDMLKGDNPISKGFYEPIDIAKAVMIFAGDATAQVTGEVFDVSFGVSARNIG